jgi:hypothetical protein
MRRAIPRVPACYQGPLRCRVVLVALRLGLAPVRAYVVVAGCRNRVGGSERDYNYS